MLKYCWDQEIVVYNCLSGDTHVLDIELFNLLEKFNMMSDDIRIKKINEELNCGSDEVKMQLEVLFKLNLLIK